MRHETSCVGSSESRSDTVFASMRCIEFITAELSIQAWNLLKEGNSPG